MAAALAALDEDVEALARRQDEVARGARAPDRAAVLADDGETVTVQGDVVEQVGADVGDPPQLRLSRRERELRAQLPVHEPRRRLVGRDLALSHGDRAAVDLHVAERERALADAAEPPRQDLLEPLDDQQSGHAAHDLLLGRAVQVHVVPVGPGSVILRQLDGGVDRARRLEDAEDVVRISRGLHVQPVVVDVRPLAGAVAERHLEPIARPHPQGGTDQAAVERLRLERRAGDVDHVATRVELGLQHAVAAPELARLLERPAGHRRPRRRWRRLLRGAGRRPARRARRRAYRAPSPPPLRRSSRPPA